MSDLHGVRRLVVGAALVDDLAAPTRLLAARRTEPSRLAGGWELPGGKVEAGEDCITALHREILEELGVRIELGDPITGPLTDGDQAGAWPLGDAYALHAWWATPTDGEPRPLEDHDELRWLSRAAVYDVAWLRDDLPVVRAIEPRLILPQR
ncbi:(deoxy)nucleoside triphosphate pyrophosphohydrolase [Demetria terragena]|uniref:(deoxy)nucleoside triphosphate pyrophosphohydrolase n=1 Tax=Demetria terragena TaxID=63959 RepID=UPI00036C2977|nr:NUDIX domain-containing protein [Demetria terragena]